MPVEADLPPSLASLAYCSAIEIDQGPDFGHQVGRLIKGIERFLPPSVPRGPVSALQPASLSSTTLGAMGQQPDRGAQSAHQVDLVGPVPAMKPAAQERLRDSESVQAPLPKSLSADDPNWNVQPRPTGTITSKVVWVRPTLAERSRGPAVARNPQTSTRLRRLVSSLGTFLATLTGLAVFGLLIYGVWSLLVYLAAGGGTRWTNSIGMRFVLIKPGKFLMGSTKDQIDELKRLYPYGDMLGIEDEQPQHLVTITRPFLLGDCEVTQRQYRAILGENPSLFREVICRSKESPGWRPLFFGMR